jgi:hypothetical protein
MCHGKCALRATVVCSTVAATCVGAPTASRRSKLALQMHVEPTSSRPRATTSATAHLASAPRSHGSARLRRYIPQHSHNERCLSLIAAHEALRGAKYDLVIRIRPDMNVTRPIRPLAELLPLVAPKDAPPALCAQGGGLELGSRSAALAERPLTMDDKFGLFPRHVADTYMNATAAFAQCQERRRNEPQCGLFDSTTKLPKAAAAKGMRSKHQPYWATPQCVLKRHLLSAEPRLRVLDCLRDSPGGQGRPLLRLVRP